LPGLRIQLNCGGGKISSQLKKAYNSGARLALVLEAEDGQQETGASAGLATVRLRHLDDEATSSLVAIVELVPTLRGLISGA